MGDTPEVRSSSLRIRKFMRGTTAPSSQSPGAPLTTPSPIAEHIRTELVAGAIFHSDHESHYTSNNFAMLPTELGAIQSTRAVGTSVDDEPLTY
jgi:hypothetical protein